MDDPNSDDWKDAIREKIADLFGSSPEKLARLMWYMDAEDNAYRGTSVIAPVWKTLRTVLNSVKAFKMYADKIVEDTKRAERDPSFRETMNIIYEMMNEPSDRLLDDGEQQGFSLSRVVENQELTITSGLMGFARSWSIIPASTQRQILAVIPKLVTNRNVLMSIDEIVGLANRAGGNIVMVGLAAVYLSGSAIRTINKWWNGEITGVRCVKDLIDLVFTVVGGFVGGIGGAALGSAVGPIGTVIGGIVGGIIASQGTNVLVDRLTQTLFGIPKEAALENAYNYLGVRMTASNNEVNTAFRKLCLKHHPDKGGNSDEFHVVQLNMAVVKAARGYLY